MINTLEVLSSFLLSLFLYQFKSSLIKRLMLTKAHPILYTPNETKRRTRMNNRNLSTRYFETILLNRTNSKAKINREI